MCRLSGLMSACSGEPSKKYEGLRTTNWSIGALLAKGMDAFEAAALGALAHVLAARAAADRLGPDHVMAGDVIEALPNGLTLR